MRPHPPPTPRTRRGPSGPQLLAVLLGGFGLLAAALAINAVRDRTHAPARAQHPPVAAATPLLERPVPPAAAVTSRPTATPSPSAAPEPGETTARRSLPHRPAPPSHHPDAVLLARIQELLRRGQTRQARELLLEQLQRREDPELRMILAFVYLQEDDASNASRQLDQVPRAEQNADWYELKGRALYQLGKLRDAVRALERALALGAPVGDLLAKARRELEQVGTLRSRSSEHFTLAIEGEPAPRLAHAVLDAAEDGFRRLNRDFKLSFRGQIPIILYTRRSFAEVTRAPDWAGAIYDGKMRLPAGNMTEVTSAFKQVLDHELTHAMIRQKAGPGCPGWLHEGVAQHYEGKRFEVRWRALGSPSAELLDSARTQANPALYYLRSLALVQFMRHRYGPTSVMRLLDALHTEPSPEAALREALRTDPRRFEREWMDWLRKQTR